MNTITVFGNQTKEVNFFPAKEDKKAFAIMPIADNVDVKKADGTETRMSVFYTVKAWEKKAEQIAEEDHLNDEHNKFYKITGKLVTLKKQGKNGKEYINKEIHADKIELIYTPGVDVPKSKQEEIEAA